MDVALLLLLPLIGGFLFVKDANFIKYEVAREDGHRFYFRAAYYGLWCFLGAVALFFALRWLKDYVPCLDVIQEWIVAAISPMLKEQKQARGQINFATICLFSIALGRVAPYGVNKVLRRTNEEALQAAAAKDELEGLLVDAITGSKMISVTMSSGKVYAGQPIGTAEPRSARKAIAILPLVSGYREENGELVFTTHYDRIFSESSNAADFRLVLPLDKIVSAAFFDAQVYEKFNAIKPEEKKSSPANTALLGLGLVLVSTLADKLSSAAFSKAREGRL